MSSLLGIYPGIGILGLMETHITGDPDGQSVQVLLRIPGFTFLSRNRPTGKGGGVGMYLSSKMCFDRRKDLEYDNIECIWVEIICRFAKNFLVCCMYKSPSSSRYLPNNFNDRMQAMLSTATAENKEVIVLGDVYVNYFVKEDNREFKEILTLSGLKQMVKDATRTCKIAKTQIDIIASNNCKNIQSINVFPSGFSDHDLIGCIRKVHHLRFKPKEIHCRDYRSYNPGQLDQDLTDADWSGVYDTNDANIAWKAFHKIMSTSIDTHAQ